MKSEISKRDAVLAKISRNIRQADRLIKLSNLWEKSKKGVKVKVSERALLARINRVLAKQDQKLIKCRERSVRDLGDYYAINVPRNVIIKKDVKLEDIGHRLAVIKPYEELG